MKNLFLPFLILLSNSIFSQKTATKIPGGYYITDRQGNGTMLYDKESLNTIIDEISKDINKKSNSKTFTLNPKTKFYNYLINKNSTFEKDDYIIELSIDIPNNLIKIRQPNDIENLFDITSFKNTATDNQVKWTIDARNRKNTKETNVFSFDEVYKESFTLTVKNGNQENIYYKNLTTPNIRTDFENRERTAYKKRITEIVKNDNQKIQEYGDRYSVPGKKGLSRIKNHGTYFTILYMDQIAMLTIQKKETKIIDDKEKLTYTLKPANDIAIKDFGVNNIIFIVDGENYDVLREDDSYIKSFLFVGKPIVADQIEIKHTETINGKKVYR